MRLSRQDFEHLVQRAFEELPTAIREALDNVDIALEDWPSKDEIKSMGLASRYELFGLYTGVPLTEREASDPLLPDRILLFQRPIEAACNSAEVVVEQIKITLRHEIGHYLGLEEEDLERLGYG